MWHNRSVWYTPQSHDGQQISTATKSLVFYGSHRNAEKMRERRWQLAVVYNRPAFFERSFWSRVRAARHAGGLFRVRLLLVRHLLTEHAAGQYILSLDGHQIGLRDPPPFGKEAVGLAQP